MQDSALIAVDDANAAWTNTNTSHRRPCEINSIAVHCVDEVNRMRWFYKEFLNDNLVAEPDWRLPPEKDSESTPTFGAMDRSFSKCVIFAIAKISLKTLSRVLLVSRRVQFYCFFAEVWNHYFSRPILTRPQGKL
jgi:hypothetical protein